MYRCEDCGAYLDKPWEAHDCDACREAAARDRQRRRNHPGGDYDMVLREQLIEQERRYRMTVEEWYAL